MTPDPLAQGWLRLLRGAGATATDRAVRAAGESLLGRWDEPHRRYHDRRHLQSVLEAIEVVQGPATLPRPDARDGRAVRLAAWFHDAVYAGRPGADEQESAALAEQMLTRLEVPAVLVDETARLVLLTAGHDPAPDDDAGAVLCDADLAVLAGEGTAYAAYAEAVRAEYAHVPDELFRAGRAAVLSTLLKAPFLFRTDAARGRWEQAARANVTAEIARLTDPLPGTTERPTR